MTDENHAAESSGEPPPIDLREHLIELRPEAIADELEGWDAGELRTLLSVLSDQVAAAVIANSDPPLARRILEVVANDRLPRIVALSAPDDAADLLGYLTQGVRETPGADEVLEALPDDHRDAVEPLLSYGEETAGGLMTPLFISFAPSLTLDQALEAVRARPEVETIVYLYAVDPADGRLVGVLSIRDLVTHPGTARVDEIMQRDVLTLPADMDQEEVARLFQIHNLGAMPVVDGEGRALGVVTVDDVIDVLSEEAEEDILALAGVPVSHQTLESWSVRVGSRLPWLFVTLLCGLGIAWILSDFEELITEFAVLALFQPAILALGGSVGLQSSTIIVRGLAVDEIDTKRMSRVAGQELGVALAIGVACGVASALLTQVLALFVGTSAVSPLALGGVVGISIVIGMTLAAMIGTLIPLVLDRAGIDPAMASGPFITVLSDCCSLLIFFTVASVLLRSMG